jgi:hypothetical protein
MPITAHQWGIIYKLRVLRRETLVWIKLLKSFSTELSRLTIPNSSACNCTSSQETLLFCIDLVISDHLLAPQVAICFARSSTADLRTETLIPLAVVNKPTSHASSWDDDDEEVEDLLLAAFFSWCLAFFTSRA